MALSRRLSLLISLILIFFIIYLHYHYVSRYLNIAYIHHHLEILKKIVEEYYCFSVAIYILIYMIATLLCVPGTSILAVISGMLFNWIPGIGYALFASTIGTTILFLYSRYLIGTWLQKKYSDYLILFNKEIMSYGRYYLFTVRLLGLLPFGLVTMISSLTIIPLNQFILMTAAGIIPSICIYSYTGFQLAKVEYATDIYSTTLLGPSLLIIFGKIIMLPLVIKIIHSRNKSLQINNSAVTHN